MEPIIYFMENWGTSVGAGTVVVIGMFVVREIRAEIRQLKEAHEQNEHAIRDIRDQKYEAQFAEMRTEIKNLNAALAEIKTMLHQILTARR
jgi:tetrahydrodipicolinate N-succinyltransferase